ncbi:hypothetical protein niasHT_035519 [Heterodera trifolii]|uniref:Uncharacterized protein n=1 Tax=Heterodera trifolii TaxID=157864 RepID=A0ABD2IF49_9BILA
MPKMRQFFSPVPSFLLLLPLFLSSLWPSVLAHQNNAFAAAENWNDHSQIEQQNTKNNDGMFGKLRVSVANENGKMGEKQKKERQIEGEEEEKQRQQQLLVKMREGAGTLTDKNDATDDDNDNNEQSVETEGILDHLDYLIRGGVEKPQQPDTEQPRGGGGTRGNDLQK